MAPLRLLAGTTRAVLRDPLSPLTYTGFGRAAAAAAWVLEESLGRRAKPSWGISEVEIAGQRIDVEIETLAERPFCRLIRFARRCRRRDPRVLVVAPMSGHHATLLRDTVAALLPEHDVYVTDWIDARLVPLSEGRFGLEEYLGYLLDFLRRLGPDVHVVAVSQPTPLVIAAVALLASAADPAQPRSMTLLGGPVEPRAAPTMMTSLVASRSLAWLEQAAITGVPWYHPGASRLVFPGFLQLGTFATLGPLGHSDAHLQQFQRLVLGDGESAAGHRRFYEEYLSVMDVTAEYYLESLESIFRRHDLAEGTMTWRGHPVRPQAIARTALMTVEGERDEVAAPGQTLAAHPLCAKIPAARRAQLLVPRIGHFGLFNGRVWRQRIRPAVSAFVRRHDPAAAAAEGLTLAARRRDGRPETCELPR